MHRNIVTHHAEDGSGVGSAIIAGKLQLLQINAQALTLVDFSYDEDQKGCWTVSPCLTWVCMNQIEFVYSLSLLYLCTPYRLEVAATQEMILLRDDTHRPIRLYLLTCTYQRTRAISSSSIIGSVSHQKYRERTKRGVIQSAFFAGVSISLRLQIICKRPGLHKTPTHSDRLSFT